MFDIKEWGIVKKLFGDNKSEARSHIIEMDPFFFEQVTKTRYKNYALNICIGRIANALNLCDFQTFIRGKPEKKEMFWLFNYEPNKNQNKIDFWYDVIYKMVYNYDEGALIIQSKRGELLIAESFDIDERAFKENTYRNIVLSGGLQYDTVLTEKQVMHLKLNNGQIKKIVDSVYEDYERLLSNSIRNYNRGNAMKLKLAINSEFEQFRTMVVTDDDGNPKLDADGHEITEYDMILDDLMTERFKGIFEDKDSLTPLETGLDILEILQTKGNTKSGTVNTRDITSLFDDILHMVANAFNFPRGIIKGDVADNEGMRKSMIDDAIRPFINQIEKECNRKLYGKEEFLKGNKLKIRTNHIFTRDPIAFANAAEAYLRIGVYCVNDILEMLGEEIIDESWAYEHYVTKNYESINRASKEIENAVTKLMRITGKE